MRTLRVAEDIVPIGKFKGQAARWLHHVADTDQPVVITQNGKPAGVLLSPREFDRLRDRQAFLESVAAGVADADAGRLVDTDDLRRHLAHQLGTRTK